MTYGKCYQMQIRINGLYGWGVGWIGDDYPGRWWSALCEFQDSHRDNEFFGGRCNLIEPKLGASAMFVGPKTYAYMHPMEIIVETYNFYVNKYTTTEKDLRETAEVFLEFILNKFSDVKNFGATTTIKSYKFNMDNAKTTKFVINNE